MKLEDGRYLASAVDWGLGLSDEKKTPFLKVKFKIKDQDATIFWDCFFSEKTKERNMETLVATGLLKYGVNLTDCAKGVAGGALDTSVEVELVIENEMYKDKMYPKVSWVNIPGGGKMKGLLDAGEAVTTFKGLGLDELAKFEFAKRPTPKTVTQEQIPF